jgi:hypothetical protein
MEVSKGVKIVLSERTAKVLFTILDEEYSNKYVCYGWLLAGDREEMSRLRDMLQDVVGEGIAPALAPCYSSLWSD